MSRSFRLRVAWIALAAVLFGAVSPALAAALFRDRPDVLGRMLAIPAPLAVTGPGAPQEAAADADDGCPHEFAGGTHEEAPSHSAHHGNSGHESHESTEHAAHGIFCSFCLTASSVVTLLSVEPEALPIALADTHVPGGTERQSGQAAPALHPARGPPAPSR